MSGSGDGTKISAAIDVGVLQPNDMLPLARAGSTTAYHATIAEISSFVSATITTGVSSWNTRTGPVTLQTADIVAAFGAPIASPAFTGIPTAPTALAGTSTGQLATTQFVTSAVTGATAGVASWNTRTGAVVMTLSDITNAGGAPLASPALSGTPTAPTAAPTTNNTQIATTAFVAGSYAPLASPALTGTPTAPTVTPATDSTTKLATTGFVQSAIGAISAGVTSWNTRSGAVTLLAADVSGVGGALLASPAFTGTPTVPTAAAGTNTTQAASTAYVQAAIAADPALNDTGRNFVQNAVFAVAQRGAGPWTANYAYTMDRWYLVLATDTASITQAGMSDTDRVGVGDESAQFCLRNAFTGNAAAGAFNQMAQSIENVRRLANRTVTLSFWAMASTGAMKLGASIDQYFGTPGSGGSALVTGNGQSVTLGTTWQRFSLTFSLASVAGKAIGTSGNDCTTLNFWFSSGATNAARAGNVGVQSGTAFLWGIQLEIGTQATQLDKGGTPQQQLSACQRFYQLASLYMVVTGQVSGGAYYIQTTLPVTMRATPSVVVASNSNNNVSGFTASSDQPYRLLGTCTSTAGGQTAMNCQCACSADL